MVRPASIVSRPGLTSRRNGRGLGFISNPRCRSSLATSISIKTEATELHVFGDTAVMHVDEHESENYFGHAIKAEYRSLQTWRRTAGGWKLIGAQVYAGLIDPPSIKLPVARLDEYAGIYRL